MTGGDLWVDRDEGIDDVELIDDDFDEADLSWSKMTMERPIGWRIGGTFKSLYSKAKKGIDTMKENRQKWRHDAQVQWAMTMQEVGPPPVK